MSAIGSATIATAVVGGYVQSQSAKEAAGAQKEASKKSIAEQQRQFDAIQELLRPYVDTGAEAIGQQGALLGLAGPEAQAEAIRSLQQSPQFQALTQQGESALLQNAAATGGLRGGNLQSALAQFRPQLLGQTIESQLGRLGGLASLGQASAAGVGAAGQQTASNIGNLLTQQGQAQAGAALAQGQAVSNVGQSIGQIATLKALGVF